MRRNFGSSRFRGWARHYRLSCLADKLTSSGHPTTRSAVSSWINGRTRPTYERAKAIVVISSWRISMADIYPDPPRRRRR
jgi:hypothetical protein